MYHEILKKPSFHALFAHIDDELAKTAQVAACPFCSGPLYKANYPRSPLGLPASCREHYDTRRSLCCGNCRKRVTTPSVRFLGRCRFPAAINVLIAAFMSRASRRRHQQVTRYFGISISLRTWGRWLRWWRDCFIGTAFWKQAKASIPTGEDVPRFPRQLLLIFSGNMIQKLTNALQFLAPMTAGVYRAV